MLITFHLRCKGTSICFRFSQRMFSFSLGRTKKGASVWMCRWQGSVALLQTESVGFTFLYVRMENWVQLMLQNEYLRNWTFRRSINNIEFQTNKKPEAEKSRRKIYLSDSRKAGKFICLLRPSNGWLHLKVDWSGRMKVNIKGLPKTIIGIICIRNCPLPSEMVMLRRVGIKILGWRIRIKLSLSARVLCLSTPRIYTQITINYE